MQYLILAYDGTDSDVPARRLAVRGAHLANVAPLVEARTIHVGGAILDERGGMIGSMVLVEFPSRADLDAWLESDPYVTGKVWQRIEVLPFRVAVPEHLRPKA
jgi:uncharacterized protein YciI